MAIISTGSHPKALWPGVKAWFGRVYNEHVVEYTDLFETDTSTQNFEEDVELTSFGLAPVKPEGTAISYEGLTQGYTKRYTHIAYALGYIVTEEEIDDNLYPTTSKTRAGALAWSFRQTRETIAALVYNRAFSSSYVGGDGQALLVTTHPSLAGDWQNILTNAADLSEVALEDLCILVMNATNSKGLNINLMPKCLIIPTALTFDATRILKSNLQNDTGNNALNALKDKGVFPDGIKINHYLTDTDAYFIRTNVPRGMIHYERKIKDFEQDNDFDTGNAKAKKYERYSFGWTDPRGLFGSPGV